MPQKYSDTWHNSEAADERAWLDSWIRMDRELAAARLTTRLSLAGWPSRQRSDLSPLASPS
jgi:hypothetical protein